MLKKMVKTVIVGAGLLALVGTAQAADININLYGASAQYKFWNDAADDFLLGKNCTNVQQAQHTDSKGKKKHGITKGTCGTDTVYIRYSAKASYDGIYSCKGQVPPAEVGGQPTCSASGPRFREMASLNGITWGTADTGVVANLDCQEVNIGASDVDGATFGQTSKGDRKGCGSGDYQDRNVKAIDTTGMTNYRPVIVPFGFFVNEAVNTTTSGAPISPEPMTNLSRLQALLLFSGQAFMWSDFGGDLPEKDVVVCLRHAGSGTHATLDAAVMRGDWPLITEEDCPYFQFNDGSSDLMACVNGNGDNTMAAVGYADADKNADDKYTNVKALDYNGAAPVKNNIKNGVYSFWSAQWLFECDPTDATLHPWVTDLAAFASIASNLPASKADWWCTQGEMNVTKTNDFVMPGF